MAETCCGCGGTIEVRALQAKQKRALVWVMAINLATFTMMVAAALHSGSSSLLSGALDNLGDALTYALSLMVVAAGLRAKARVAFFKGLLILAAAVAVAAQVGWRLRNPGVPLFESMGLAALLNLACNLVCLRILWPYRQGDINLASAWECSRNDVYEGVAVVVAAAGVGLWGAGWPDLLVAAALLVLFLRSAWRVLRSAWRDLRAMPPA